jgi:hypothetical protein
MSRIFFGSFQEDGCQDFSAREILPISIVAVSLAMIRNSGANRVVSMQTRKILIDSEGNRRENPPVWVALMSAPDSGKIFGLGVLMYGKEPNWREIWRWPERPEKIKMFDVRCSIRLKRPIPGRIEHPSSEETDEKTYSDYVPLRRNVGSGRSK